MTVLRRLSLSLLVLYPLTEILCYALLHWRRNDLAIRKRNKWSICIACFAGWFAYFNLVVSLFGGVPCGIFYVVSLLIAPMSVGPQLVRALSLKGTLKHSKLLTEDDIILSRDPNGRRASRCSDNSSSEKKVEATLVLMRTKLLVKVTIAALVIIPLLVLVVAFAMSDNADNLLTTDFSQCNSESAYFFLTPAFGIASTAIALLANILIRNAQDELGLRSEIMRNVIFLGITYVLILVIRLLGHAEWQPLLQTIQQMFLSFSMIAIPCFSALEFVPPSVVIKQNQASVASTSASTLPGYARPIPRSKRPSVIGARISKISPAMEQREREMTVSWDAGLCILLSTQQGINAFSQHCAREFSSENVKFWVAVNEYKATFDEESFPSMTTVDTDDNDSELTNVLDTEEIVAKAKEIYASFVEDTTHQVNLSSRHKNDLKKAIESKELKKDTFDAAQKEIFGVMARDSYPRYLRSK